MVEVVEVDVGEELAGLIAQRQTAAALGRAEQVVADIPLADVFLRVGVVDDTGGQLQNAPVLDLAVEPSLEELMVNTREVFLDVALQHIAMAAGEGSEAVHGGMSAFALATGVAIEKEAALEDRFEEAAQGVMHHPVAERGGADQPPFRLVNLEGAAGPGR